LKPLIGTLLCKGIWPPSNQKRYLCPLLWPAPLWPLPAVVPKPDPWPLPTLLDFFNASVGLTNFIPLQP
jgi:hypothetical protein